MSSGVSGIMSALKAEELLEGSQLFDQVKKLCADLRYSTEDGKFAFDDYFATLVDAVDAIPKLELENDVAPGTETTYQIQLGQAAEQIVDECDRIFRRMSQFNGKLKQAERDVNNLKAEFVAWYMLAASALLKDLDDIKLPMAEIRRLGEAEFSRLMGGLDAALIHLIEAMKIEANKVTHHKAAQKEKYEYGQDQANASWTSTLPAFGNAVSSERPDTLGAQEADDEDVPEVVKQKPNIIRDTLRIVKPDEALLVDKDGIKGTFTKIGDPQPAKTVADNWTPPKEVRCGKTTCHRPECLDCYPNGYMVPKRVSEGHSLFPDGTPNPPLTPRKRLILEEDEVV